MSHAEIVKRIDALNKMLAGTEATYDGERGKRTKHVTGVIREVQWAECAVTNERGTFLGIEMLIKPKVGRPVWTWAMADEFEETA